MRRPRVRMDRNKCRDLEEEAEEDCFDGEDEDDEEEAVLETMAREHQLLEVLTAAAAP